MKSTITSNKSKLALSLLIFFFSTIALFGFKDHNAQAKQYMCITVDEQHDYQIIYISAANKPMERIAVLDPARTTRFNFLKKDYTKRGFTIDQRSLQYIYDYSAAFEIVNKYEKQGWKLVSHGIGSSGYDDISDHRSSQFLMTR